MPASRKFLSDRQKQCLRMVADGMTSKEIAVELGGSPQVVDNHLHAAMKILGASNRREAARLFIEIENQGVSLSHMKPAGVAPPSDSAIPEASAIDPRHYPSWLHPLIGLATWLIGRIGGKRHDLSKSQVLLSIGFAALVSAGMLALIVATFYWLNSFFS